MLTYMQEQLLDAATLLLVGMSVVFVFLTLLIGAVNTIAWVNRLLPEETPAQSAFVPANKAGQVAPQTVAAIAAAIHQHRSKHTR